MRGERNQRGKTEKSGCEVVSNRALRLGNMENTMQEVPPYALNFHPQTTKF